MEDLIVLIDRLGMGPVDVLGFSYGGLLAQCLVVRLLRRSGVVVIALSSILPVPPDAFAG